MAGGQTHVYQTASQDYQGTSIPDKTAIVDTVSQWARFPRNNGGKKAVWQFVQANGYYPVAAYSANFDKLVLTMGRETLSYLSPQYVPPWSVTIVDKFGVDQGSTVTAPFYNMKDHAQSGAIAAKATAQANSRLRDARMAMAETLAEAEKTANMILNRITRVVNAGRAVRNWTKNPTHRNFQKIERALGVPVTQSAQYHRKPQPSKNVANNWLEFRYGWTPLMNEIYGGMTLLHDGFKRKNQIIVIKGRNSVDWTESGFSEYRGRYYDMNPGYTYGATGGGQFRTYRLALTANRTYGVEIGYVIRVDNPHIQANKSLGLDNPALIAWELVPLSFVADWFVNVSDCLEQLTAFTGNTFMCGYKTTYRRNQYTALYQTVWTNDKTYEKSSGFSPAKITADRVDMVREVLTIPPTFGLHLDNGLNLNRLVDAASLAKQVFR